MQFANETKMNVLLSMLNPFDLNEYKEMCLARGYGVVGTHTEYAQKVGMVKVAITLYPELTPVEAYLRFVQDPNNSIRLMIKGDGTSGGDCSACPERNVR